MKNLLRKKHTYGVAWVKFSSIELMHLLWYSMSRSIATTNQAKGIEE